MLLFDESVVILHFFEKKTIKNKKHAFLEILHFKVSYNFVQLFWSIRVDKKMSYLLYGSVASLPSPSSNIESWPFGTSLRFASLLHLGH